MQSDVISCFTAGLTGVLLKLLRPAAGIGKHAGGTAAFDLYGVEIFQRKVENRRRMGERSA